MKEICFKIPLVIQKERECESASLLQVLRYYKDNSVYKDIISYCKNQPKFKNWDYLLGNFSIKKGYNAKVHTRSLFTFDSTWFGLDKESLENKLKKEIRYLKRKSSNFVGYKKLQLEVESALDFLQNGGKIDFSSFSKELIISYLDKKIPLIATFTPQLIFSLPREINGKDDDIKGEPWKHSLVINGYKNDKFCVTDPANFQKKHRYSINADLLIDSIIRYDNNLLIISRNKLP